MNEISDDKLTYILVQANEQARRVRKCKMVAIKIDEIDGCGLFTRLPVVVHLKTGNVTLSHGLRYKKYDIYPQVNKARIKGKKITEHGKKYCVFYTSKSVRTYEKI